MHLLGKERKRRSSGRRRREGEGRKRNKRVGEGNLKIKI